MNELSQKILETLQQEFKNSDISSFQNGNSLVLLIVNRNNSPIGDLVIQTTEEKYIWLRNFFPHSGIVFESLKELIKTLNWIFEDKMFWVISHKSDQ